MRDSVESKIFKLTYLKIKHSWLEDMWQFQIEIKNYSVAHFDCITAFKVLYR